MIARILVERLSFLCGIGHVRGVVFYVGEWSEK